MNRQAAAEDVARVLVVDDDEDSRLLIQFLLERQGYTVVLADSGPAAISVLESTEVDVVVLDVMMPMMDGFAVCRELKKLDSTASVPVILLTARDDMQTRATGMKLGVSDFLAKPVKKEELYARIRTQLDGRQRARELEKAQRRVETL
ncbi:MAG: response regulator [Deltaproteobacteria bacterium]|nr:response regulator [Deltaproteobacteria bacterium]